jgi:hypothetical protein
MLRHLLRHCAASRKVAVLRSDELNAFYTYHLASPAALSLRIRLDSNRNEYQGQKYKIYLVRRGQSVPEAVNLIAIYETLDTLGASASHSSQDVHGLLRG